MQELFDSVPKIHREDFHKAMNFKPVFCDDRFLNGIPAGRIGKEDCKYITHLPDYAVGEIKFPKGVKEVTTEQYIKWGGKIGK